MSCYSPPSLTQARRPSGRSRQVAMAVKVDSLPPLTPAYFRHHRRSSSASSSSSLKDSVTSLNDSDLDVFDTVAARWPPTPPNLGSEEEEDIQDVASSHTKLSMFQRPQTLFRSDSTDSFRCRGLGMFDVELDQGLPGLELPFVSASDPGAAWSTKITPPRTSTSSHLAFADAVNSLSSPIGLSALKLDSLASGRSKKRRRSTRGRLDNITAGQEGSDKGQDLSSDMEGENVHPGLAARRMSDFTTKSDQGQAPPNVPCRPPARPPRPEASTSWNAAFTTLFPHVRSVVQEEGAEEDDDDPTSTNLHGPFDVKDAVTPYSPTHRIIGVPRVSQTTTGGSRGAGNFPLDVTFALETFPLSTDLTTIKNTGELPHFLTVHRRDTISMIKQGLAATLCNAGVCTRAEELIVSVRSNEVAPQVTPRLRLNSIVDYEPATATTTTPMTIAHLATRKGSVPLPSPSYTTLLWAAAAKRRASATPAMTFSSSSTTTTTSSHAPVSQTKQSLTFNNNTNTTVIPPGILTARWRELVDDTATLAHVGVTATDHIVVASRQTSYALF